MFRLNKLGVSLLKSSQDVDDRPSFDFNALIPGSGVAGTRASDGTYTDSDCVLQTASTDVMRSNNFADYDPATGDVLGFLIEEQRTNLLTYSEQFDNAAWTNTNTTDTSNTTTAPDGTTTADTITDSLDGANTTHVVAQSVSFTSGAAYTLSVFAKQGALVGTEILLPSAAFGADQRCRFNLSTGVGTVSGGSPEFSIVTFPDGWYRCSITATATASASGLAQVRTATASTAFYQGDGTGTIFLWGAQLELGAFPTSYTKTVASAATRARDIATITDLSDINYNTSEGSIVVEFRTGAINTAASARVFTISDNTSANAIKITLA